MVFEKFNIKYYSQIINHAKNILNYEQFDEEKNNVFYDKLSQYFLNIILSKSNYGYMLILDNKVVGVIFCFIPNYQKTFLNPEEVQINNEKILFEIQKLKLSNIQKTILDIEMLTNINNDEIYKVFNYDLKDSCEIMFLSVLKEYQNKKIGSTITNNFINDIKKLNFHKIHLYTTTLCNYKYYEYKKMNSFKLDIIGNKSKNPNFEMIIKDFPLIGIVYYCDINKIKF